MGNTLTPADRDAMFNIPDAVWHSIGAWHGGGPRWSRWSLLDNEMRRGHLEIYKRWQIVMSSGGVWFGFTRYPFVNSRVPIVLLLDQDMAKPSEWAARLSLLD